jgi:hypothetical protein
MEEASGDKKVKEAVSPVTVHFLLLGQFLGLRGSSGPLNLIWGRSVSVSVLQRQQENLPQIDHCLYPQAFLWEEKGSV